MKLELNSTKIIEQVTGDLKNIENVKNINNQNKFVQELNNKYDTEYMIASLIMKKAIEYTPYKTGRLRDSIYMEPLEQGIKIGYKADYAIYVHEIGFYQHKEPTRYKFLEDAAYEVALETETPYRVSISYEPLAVYINVPGQGVDLFKIKDKERENKKLENKTKVWEEYTNYNDKEASEEERIYHNKMAEFFEYWQNKGYGYWWVLDEWQDRNRHN